MRRLRWNLHKAVIDCVSFFKSKIGKFEREDSYSDEWDLEAKVAKATQLFGNPAIGYEYKVHDIDSKNPTFVNVEEIKIEEIVAERSDSDSDVSSIYTDGPGIERYEDWEGHLSDSDDFPNFSINLP